jgi:hypothetical protein
VIAGVVRVAAEHGAAVVAIVGSTGPGAGAGLGAGLGAGPGPGARGPARVICLSERFGLQRAMREPAALIEEAAREIVMEMLNTGR